MPELETPPAGETTPTPVSPVVTTPPVVTPDPAVEAAKREADQAKMRANQLENELKKLNDASAAAEAKRLADQNEFKTLYEQTQATLEQMKKDDEAKVTAAGLAAASETMFKDFPANVVEIAKTAGISLTGDTDADKAVLKEKLEAIQKQAGGAPKTTPNNPYQPTGNPVDRETLVTRVDGVSPMAMAGARGDTSVARQYISTLPAIEKMRQIASEN